MQAGTPAKQRLPQVGEAKVEDSEESTLLQMQRGYICAWKRKLLLAFFHRHNLFFLFKVYSSLFWLVSLELTRQFPNLHINISLSSETCFHNLHTSQVPEGGCAN